MLSIGQGANQALDDGPLLAHWLGAAENLTKGKRKRDKGAGSSPTCGKESEKLPENNLLPPNVFSDPDFNVNLLYTRLRCFEREMVARASSKAKGSRDAAHHLHSSGALQDVYGIEGVALSDVTAHGLVSKLREERVNAALSAELDSRMKESLRGFLEVAKSE